MKLFLFGIYLNLPRSSDLSTKWFYVFLYQFGESARQQKNESLHRNLILLPAMRWPVCVGLRFSTADIVYSAISIESNINLVMNKIRFDF